MTAPSADDEPTPVSAHTRHVLAYGQWMQHPVRDRYVQAVQDIVRDDSLVSMDLISQLTHLSANTVGKALLKMSFLQVNDGSPFPVSTWEKVPESLRDQVWYREPRKPRVRAEKVVTTSTTQEVVEIEPDESWLLDLSNVDVDKTTIAELFASARALGLDIEVRLARRD